MKRRTAPILGLGLIVLTAAAAQAHTLRVLVTRPVPTAGHKNTVYLSYGHLLPVDELIPAAEVGPYEMHTPSGSVKPLELSGYSMHANEVVFNEPGMYQLSVIRQSLVYVSYVDAAGKVGFARLPKSKFTLPDGAKLTASARSHQFSKAVVLNQLSAGAETPVLGHPLEIIVESKPGKAGYSADEPAKVRVLFQGKPLAGVKVSAASVSRNPDGIPGVASETDAEGRASLDLVEPGSWVIDVLHLIDASAEDRADFDKERFVATVTIPIAEN